ncbi:M1 family metallopeptidase [Luteimonas mephitis]|uniref:M1 family metallopeptidase n=1 Tax=Luteimonas mephitis TaxID=83615 RepID=UPI0004203B04|nr:M1 family metallopeptidase [Luteimonas mephitis]
MRALLISLGFAVALAGCQRDAADTATSTPTAKPAAAAPASVDEHSYAEPGKVAIDDLALDLKIDFDARTISGTATYTLDWKDKDARQLVLDTRDLSIDKVEGESKDGQWQPLQYGLAERDAIFGSKFTIEAPERNAHIRVTYATSPEASGLQWLEPAMTEGKQLPFMFSQSQQIHARSWVPLQDTPSVRYTYSAHVTSRPDVMVLMSADNDPKAARDGDYTFKMPQKIPSYLMAIAAGDLVFKPISERSGVWAEPAMVDKAQAEFADTEKMIETAEALYGPYRWGRYDILVLPPSFPYGGMENPRLTFATPTVIVGDKSLVSLVAHELAHSWSGNLVTFSSAKDAWLNEGVTSYVENRIIEALYGKDQADMESVIARNELAEEFKTVDPKLQVLAEKPGDLKDPDNSSGATVYTKGAWFLQFLEQRFGRADFDAFLRGYFDHFAFQSISSEQFADYAEANLLRKYPGKVSQEEFDEWLYQPGVPATAPKVLARKFGVVDSARLAWLGSGELPPPVITGAWSTQEWVHFIEAMPETLGVEQLAQLDGAYHFTGTPNGEIAQRWYPLAVRSGYTQANDAIAAFLEKIGRRKLIMPTYKALVQTEDGLALAKAVFAKAKPGYHPITTGSVQEMIDGAKPKAAPAKPADAGDAAAAAPAESEKPAIAGDATAPAPDPAPPAN